MKTINMNVMHNIHNIN